MGELNRKLFGDDFEWGVSAAALQTEGACDAEGKGQSIWDVFSSKKGAISNGDHHHTACDFYNRYQEDIDIVKSLNIPNFRFSISWTRVLPEGTGKVNQAGIDYYHRVIDYCLQQGVEPWVTLYHWDLPQILEAKGGWTNREVVKWFSEFVTICAEAFGSKVKHWMVMNEPSVFTGAGYFLGIHAPGKSGLKNFVPAVHHTVLSIVAGAKILRDKLPADRQIGTTFSCSFIEPYSQSKRDIAAAKRADALINRLFIEPILGLGYPTSEVTALKRLEKVMLPGDAENMSFDFDFIGVQNYTRELVEYSFFTPYVGANLVKATKRNVPTTEMGWEVYPASIYEMIKKFGSYPKVKKIIITENGVAFKDNLVDGKVDDSQRIAYLHDYLEQVLKAKNESYNVKGYFVWTLTDNFEWAEGYHPRFGLVHIDFDTLKRTVKNSGYWYRDLLGS
ncbi:GH1 family beta-glucosidase [Mucilaginibacter jinjuensis]|uniref:Beta-glucosidase n=1 Tax=Mucilaginibacter jinjuensis TaxID=1176721 RepID=A0ABY7TFM0_9SPHI|nr:GH1 family beta-glucosidase [Mucilaginibacter jinjuensis]WCT14998.1 GH1 family beta-glucosidase [Mucilaginibacter jinjuensis]